MSATESAENGGLSPLQPGLTRDQPLLPSKRGGVFESDREVNNKMATHSPPKEQFACAACGEEFARETAVSECRVCHRSYCEECLDDQGLCVPCKKA